MHVMVDLETLSTRVDAVVLSIGAVAFDLLDRGTAEGLELRLDPQSQIGVGRRVDWATVHWWMGQERAAQEALAAPGAGLWMADALDLLDRYFARVDGTHVWGNGPHFDVSILEHMYASLGRKAPWAYNRVCCVRTVRLFTPGADSLRPEPAVAHNALADATAQALWVQRMLKSRGTMGAAAGEEDQPQPPAAASGTVGEDSPAVKAIKARILSAEGQRDELNRKYPGVRPGWVSTDLMVLGDQIARAQEELMAVRQAEGVAGK